MAPADLTPAPAGAPREARDAMAFGQESGRALSDGRIVGRAEPFAKVFPSSRTVKRAVGPVAWAVLEDIALEARIDDAGRLVSETNVRQIAVNLALNKNTVNRHLARLREYGFVLREEAREVESGRWEPCRYVLDPSACVERFTATPSSDPQTESPSAPPCPNSSATASEPVSENAGHGELGHPMHRHGDVEEQHAAHAGAGAPEATAEADDRLTAAGDRWDLADVVVAAGDVDADGFQVDDDDSGDAEPTPDGRAATASGGEHAAGGGDADLYARLTAVGVACHVAEDLVARYSHQRIEDALAVVAAQPPRKPAGWIVTALRQQWDLSDRLAHRPRGVSRRRPTSWDGC